MTPRQAIIMNTWLDLEESETDISTERLMAMTQDVAKCSHDELMDALHARHNEQESKNNDN